MAAAIEPAMNLPSAELADLRDLCAADLSELLSEEIDVWRRMLAWDFNPSAELVRRFVDQRALSGFALVENSRVAGYCYFVHDEYKGLIGDLYVRRGPHVSEHERTLLGAVVGELMETPHLTRVETQLMMLGRHRLKSLPGAAFLRAYDRNFMRIGAPQMRRLKTFDLGNRILIEPWTDLRQEAAAHLIPAAYVGHIDSRINDQYDTIAGARRFLYNIVQYPGCGSFFKPASRVALDRESGQMCGLSLTSLVASTSGHITQICVAPPCRGAGLGYALLQRSLSALRMAGCLQTTLTVTAGNREAIRLYESMGFETIRKFHAFVWEGF